MECASRCSSQMTSPPQIRLQKWCHEHLHYTSLNADTRLSSVIYEGQMLMWGRVWETVSSPGCVAGDGTFQNNVFL